MPGRLLNFLLSTQLLVSLAACLLSIETRILLSLEPVCIPENLFIFFATLSAYHLYYLKTKQGRYGLFYFIPAATGSLWYFFKLQTTSQWISMFLILAAVIYLMPRFIPHPRLFRRTAFKSILLAVIWFMATWTIPAQGIHLSEGGVVVMGFRLALIVFLIFIFNTEGRVHPLKLVFILLPTIPLFFLFVQSWMAYQKIGPTYGFVSLITCVLAGAVYKYFLKKQRSSAQYLVLADGLMVLHTIFVLIAWNYGNIQQ